MCTEADYLYEYEIDEMVRKDMLGDLPEHMLQTFVMETEGGSEFDVRERHKINVAMSNGHIILYIASKYADDSGVLYLEYVNSKSDIKKEIEDINKLKLIGFNSIRDRIYEYRYRDTRYDRRRVMEKIVTVLKDTKDTVLVIENKKKCIVKFKQIPLAKYKKRLRDFGFYYNSGNCEWVGNKKEYDVVITYFSKQSNVELIVR